VLLLGAVSETARADVQPTDTSQEVAFQSNAPGAVIVEPPAAVPPDPAAPPPAEIGEVEAGAAQFVEGDARSGQAWATPTAFTSPRGSGTVQAWFPMYPVGGVAVATYGVTSRLEIGGGAMFAFEEDGVAGVVTGKLQVVRGKRAALAVQGYYADIPDEDESITLLTAVGSACLDARCAVVASGHLTAIPTQGYADDGSYGDVLLLAPGASLVAGRKIKFVAEGLAFDDGGDEFLLLYGGLRLARRSFSGDLGLVVASDGGEAELVPVPMAAVSARF
jgi:hypothetical protein